MNRLGIALAAWVFASGVAGAASPDPKDLIIPPAEVSKARELVRMLSSDVFKEREQAQDALAKMGRLARPALLEALTSDPSPEVRTRALRLIPRAEAADLQARIDTFLADKDAKFQHDLPGWNLFKKELDPKDAGTEKALREIYVDAIKTPANMDLLNALSSTPEAAGRAIAERRMTLFVQQNPGAWGRIAPGGSMTPKQPTLADIAILLLAETHTDSKYITRNQNFGITAAQFIQTQASMNAINNPDSSPQAKAYRQVFIRWMDTRVSPDDLTQVYWMANNFRNVKEAGNLLRRIVTTEGVQPYAKAQCLIFLSQRGGPDELAIIRTQLKNDSSTGNRIQIVQPNGKDPGVFLEAQIRDIALALLLHHEKQDHAKYGFGFQNGFTSAMIAQNYYGYGFKTDDDRKAAHKKFEEYEANKKKEPKKDEPKKDEPKKDELKPTPPPVKK
ncbi:MAG: hypothetical protein U0791_13995 [Gemmataceae bacterium]